MSALKESSKDGGDREGHGLPEFRQKEDKDDGRGLGCRLRDVGVLGRESLLQEEASGRLHGVGGIQLGLVSWGKDRTGGISGRRSPVGDGV